MGGVMERWCPTQQMLGVFLEETEVKKLLFVCAIGLAALTSATKALPQSDGSTLPIPNARIHPNVLWVW